jgi:hypothetical protein
MYTQNNMTKKRETKRIVPYKEHMARADDQLEDALTASGRHQEIRAAGGIPEVRYSKFSGYNVVDKLAGPPLYEK